MHVDVATNDQVQSIKLVQNFGLPDNNLNFKTNLTHAALHYTEDMADSGVRLTLDDEILNEISFGSSSSTSECRRFVSSPDSSFLGGAIDDEIGDQPQLSVHEFLGAISVEQVNNMYWYVYQHVNCNIIYNCTIF